MELIDKENRVAVIALHKCGIERTRIFELLKPLNITSVFVHRTVKLFMYTGGVSVRKSSDRLRVVRTLQAIDAVRPIIIGNLDRRQ